MSKLRIGTIAGVLGLLLPSAASAQEWLKDRRYQEGAGIRAGDLELHPGVAAEGGFDSNWFYRSDKTGANIVNGAPAVPVEGAGMLRVTPSLSISTLGPQRREGNTPEPPKLNFRAGLAATYRELFGSELIRSQRNLSGNADARIEILPQRPWGGALFANYSRTIQPTVLGNPDLSFNRNDVGGGGEIVTTPGGGTLDWHFGYSIRAALFENNQGKLFDNTTHEGSTRGRWKFRPRTALLYDATLRVIFYSNQNALNNSTPLRTRIGLAGLVTPRLGLSAMVGYGGSFFDSKGNAAVAQFDSVIANAEAKFYLTANPNEEAPSDVSLSISSLAVGYGRDFTPSFIGNYYGQDRGYAKLSYFFSGRVLVTAEGGVAALQYPTILRSTGAVSNPAFTDLRADATLFGEYRFSDSFGINSTLRFTGNFSNTQLQVDSTAPGTTGAVFDMNWKRFEAFLGARLFM